MPRLTTPVRISLHGRHRLGQYAPGVDPDLLVAAVEEALADGRYRPLYRRGYGLIVHVFAIRTSSPRRGLAC